MSKEPKENVTDQDVQRLLEDTQKQYEVYAQLQDLTSILEPPAVQEDYQRDMSHPLSLQIKG